MHHRALCLISSASLNTASTSFTAAIQAAAGRAWTRRAVIPLCAYSTNVRPRHCKKEDIKACEYNGTDPSTSQSSQILSSGSQDLLTHIGIPTYTEQCRLPSPPYHSFRAAKPTVQESLELSESPGFSSASPHSKAWGKLKQNANADYLLPEDVEDSDLSLVDPGRSDPCEGHSYEHRTEAEAAVNFDHKAHRISLHNPCINPFPSLHRPHNAASLHQNMLSILSSQSPSLPELIDYHELFPAYHSTRSHNLLIALALRHTSYGTVHWLLASMRESRIPLDLETRKLRIRWLVQTGWWDQAWDEVMGPTLERTRRGPPPRVGWRHVSQARPDVPMPLWLELFKSMKRGASRRHRNSFENPNGPGVSMNTIRAVAESTQLYTRSMRFRSLMQNRPASMSDDLARTPPIVVSTIVMLMLKTEQKASALSLTKDYLAALPTNLHRRWARGCLDLINLHVAFGPSGKGLQRFNEAHRNVITLLRSHPALKASSTTLFLLLGCLQPAKHCGTVAWKVFKAFKASWGAQVQDRRVRRKLIALAVKEGRIDIVNRMSAVEDASRWRHRSWQLERSVVGKGDVRPRAKLLRTRTRRILRGNGREQRLWVLLWQRMRRMIKKRQKK